MTRMLGLFTGGLALAVLAAPGARAGGPHYGSFGVQMGLYRYPPPGGYAVGGGHHHRSYSAPAGYAYTPGYAYSPTPGYSYTPGYSLSPGGCSGMSYSPSGGCSGMSYSPTPGPYLSPGYYSPTPQAGLLSAAGGIRETLELIREVREFLKGGGGDRGGGDGGSSADLDDLRRRVKDLEARDVPPNLKNTLKQLGDDLSAVRTTAKRAEGKADEALRGIKGLEEIRDRLDGKVDASEYRDDLDEIRRRLGRLENPPKKGATPKKN